MDRFSFEAKCKDGTLSITIVTAVDPLKSSEHLLEYFPGLEAPKRSRVLVAKELYPRMYKYFEDVGNPVKRLVGSWAWDNYADAKAVFDELIAEGKSPVEAAKVAVLQARSFVKYHKPMGFDTVLSAEHKAEYKLFYFEIVKGGQ